MNISPVLKSSKLESDNVQNICVRHFWTLSNSNFDDLRTGLMFIEGQQKPGSGRCLLCVYKGSMEWVKRKQDIGLVWSYLLGLVIFIGPTHIFWNATIIHGIVVPPLHCTGPPGWFTSPCSWAWSWGWPASPRRPWLASPARRGRTRRPWKVLLVLFLSCSKILAQSYLQVLGLGPVDVMAVEALPHPLRRHC